MLDKESKKDYYFIYCIVLIVVSLPLLGIDAYRGHDTGFHIQRIISIKNAILEGRIPVRIYTEAINGYGYGAPLFYPDIFLYIPALLCVIGIPVTVSYNIFLILINVITLYIAVYSFSRISSSKTIGIMAAVLYESSIYRLVDLYTRGSMGEYLALMFIPLIFLGLTFVIQGKKDKWYILGLGFTGVLQSHILTFVIMVALTGIVILINIKKILEKDKIFMLIKATVVTILINAWFLIPFLSVSDMNVIAMMPDEKFWNTDAQLIQLFEVSSLSVSGGETFSQGITNSIPKTVGIPIIVGCIMMAYTLISKERRKDIPNRHRKVIIGALITGSIGVIMTTNLFPWKIISKIGILKQFFEKFQFMWRFNIVAVLFLSLAAAYGYYCTFGKSINGKRILIIVCAIASMYSLCFVCNYAKNGRSFDSKEAYEMGYSDDLYLLRENRIFDREELESNAENIEYTDYKRGNSTVSFSYEIKDTDNKDFYIDVPITFYPVYVAYEDGKQIEVTQSDSGVVRVNITKKTGAIIVEYKESISYRIAEIISLISLIGVGGDFIFKHTKKLKNKRRNVC